MDSLNDILLKKDFDEPPEIAAIKAYVLRKFKEEIGVSVNQTSVVLIVKSAALASALRMKTVELQQIIGSKKRLIFRIGS